VRQNFSASHTFLSVFYSDTGFFLLGRFLFYFEVTVIMNMLKRTMCVLVCAGSTLFATAWTTNVSAHDPALHGFNLTTFDPPFPAPEFTLATMSDAQLSLSEHKGKFVLLNFWATWCPPCLKEMPSMETIHKRYQDKGFVVLAVSSDEGGKSDIQPFLDKLDISFPVLIDADKEVSTVYGAVNLPLSFILNREGQVIAGSEGAREWASKEAISVLDELLASP